jgi:hypothetical protein
MSNAPVRRIAFMVRKLSHGGVEVLLEGDSDTPRRHVCDFRSDYEARMWIAENSTEPTPPSNEMLDA